MTAYTLQLQWPDGGASEPERLTLEAPTVGLALLRAALTFAAIDTPRPGPSGYRLFDADGVEIYRYPEPAGYRRRDAEP